MATLVIFEGDGLPVSIPCHVAEVVLIADGRFIGTRTPGGGHLKNTGYALDALVARLGIFLLVQNGLELVARTAFHIIDIAFLCHRTYLAHSQMGACIVPLDIRAVIRGKGAVKAELAHLASVGLAHMHIVIGNVSHPCTVGRIHTAGTPLIVSVHPMALQELRALQGGCTPWLWDIPSFRCLLFWRRSRRKGEVALFINRSRVRFSSILTLHIAGECAWTVPTYIGDSIQDLVGRKPSRQAKGTLVIVH